MAGYIKGGSKNIPKAIEMTSFNVGQDLASILHAEGLPQVITLQLDGDEAAAFLFGFNMYQKGAKLEIRHTKDCQCGITDCAWAPHLQKTVQL